MQLWWLLIVLLIMLFWRVPGTIENSEVINALLGTRKITCSSWEVFKKIDWIFFQFLTWNFLPLDHSLRVQASVIPSERLFIGLNNLLVANQVWILIVEDDYDVIFCSASMWTFCSGTTSTILGLRPLWYMALYSTGQKFDQGKMGNTGKGMSHYFFSFKQVWWQTILLSLFSVPHVFLEVGGSITDNTYVWDDESKNYKDNGQRFYKLKSQLSLSAYSRVPLNKAGTKLLYKRLV